MESLKRSMKWDEDVFGLEYDLDLFNIVAVDDFNMGGWDPRGGALDQGVGGHKTQPMTVAQHEMPAPFPLYLWDLPPAPTPPPPRTQQTRFPYTSTPCRCYGEQVTQHLQLPPGACYAGHGN
jgi:hypothetical protein